MRSAWFTAHENEIKKLLVVLARLHEQHLDRGAIWVFPTSWSTGTTMPQCLFELPVIYADVPHACIAVRSQP